MKRLLIKGISAAVAAAMLSASCFAAKLPYTVEKDYSQNKVTVSGTTEKDGQFVVLQVLDLYYDSIKGEYKQYTYGQLKYDKTSKDMIFYRNQTAAAEGEYSFVIEYPADAVSGAYNARLATTGAEELTDFELAIVTKGDYEAKVGLLNNAADAGVVSDFVDVIKDNSLMLGMDTDLLSGLEENAMKPYMDYVKAHHLDSTKSVSNTQGYNTFVLMAALEENDVTNITPYISGTTVSGTQLHTDYKALVTEENEQTYITGKMSGKTFDGTDSFVKALKQALIFEEAYYATGYGEVKDILSKYGSTVGITTTAANDVYKEMQGKDYDQTTILADFNRLKEIYGSGTTGGGGAGGGGGGGIPGSGSKVPEMDGAYGGFESGGQAEAVKAYFNDIDGVEWATEAILALADKGIINGKSEGFFAPDDFVTREEFAKILVGAMGYSDEKYQVNVFSDVNENDWFKSYVNIAYSKNLIKGIGDGRFGSGQLISRQDMAVMLYNALKVKGAEIAGGNIPFEDKGVVADYATDAVGTLYKMGVINGVSETCFDPLGSATRAQAAKMVYGVLKFLQ